MPQVSPDGQRLAYLAPDEGVLNVWVRTLGQNDDRAVTRDRKRGIRNYLWAYDGAHLLYLQDRDGDENWHVFAVDVNTDEAARDLTPFDGVQAQIVALESKVPHQALIALNRTDRRRHDVYRIDLRSGAMTLDTENPGAVIQWVADSRLCVRAAVATTPDGGKSVLVRGAHGAADGALWRSLLTWSAEDDGRAVAVNEDGSTLYVVGSHGANTQRLIAVDIVSGVERVLAQDDSYDVADVLVHPAHRTPQAAAFHRERIEWEALDAPAAARFEVLRHEIPGQIAVVSRDLDDRAWIVSATMPDGPIRFFLYECAA